MIFRQMRSKGYPKAQTPRRINFYEASIAQNLYCFCTPEILYKVYSAEFNPFKSYIKEIPKISCLSEVPKESEIIEETITLHELNVKDFHPSSKNSPNLSYENKESSFELERNQNSAADVESDKESTSKSSPTLYIRPDVMNKNIFRAIRRQWKEVFEEFLSSRSRLNSKIKRIFRENLALFSRCLLRETQIDVSSIDGFSEQDFVKYLGLFINYCIMKRELMPTADFEKAIETNDLLYAYSHKKFRDYLSIPEVNVIIRILFERIGESEFITNHETLNSSPRAYMNQIQKIKTNILDN